MNLEQKPEWGPRNPGSKENTSWNEKGIDKLSKMTRGLKEKPYKWMEQVEERISELEDKGEEVCQANKEYEFFEDTKGTCRNYVVLHKDQSFKLQT